MWDHPLLLWAGISKVIIQIPKGFKVTWGTEKEWQQFMDAMLVYPMRMEENFGQKWTDHHSFECVGQGHGIYVYHYSHHVRM